MQDGVVKPIRYAVVASLVATLMVTTMSNAVAKDVHSTIPQSAPCGVVTKTTTRHVVWIVLENLGYSVVGSRAAPYFNSLASRCSLATNYLAVSHPSLPNYIALTSGSTQGIADDNEPSSHPLAVANIFSELKGSWRAYDESMPAPCDRVTSGSYAARHNPAVYYTNLPSCSRDDLPLTAPLDLSAAFTMITPNVCNDMHSCPVTTGDIWLKKYVATIIASSQYQSRSLVLFVTFDENVESATNRVPTIVVGPSVPRGAHIDTLFTHYSLLRSTEALLHVPVLGGARSASSMIQAFHL